MGTQFELPSEVTIYNALETHAALLAWAIEQPTKGSDQLKVSARDVAEIDGAGLQLLAALSNMNRSWAVVDASTAFIQACRAMGFELWLDSPNQKVVA
jgi:ABC-type transporter Mla MlaB component